MMGYNFLIISEEEAVPKTADKILEDLEARKFAALQVDRLNRARFTGSATVIEPEVKSFVDALYQAFLEDPDWWYPIEMDSKTDLDAAIDQARTYARDHQPRLTLSVRRRPEDSLVWHAMVSREIRGPRSTTRA